MRIISQRDLTQPKQLAIKARFGNRPPKAIRDVTIDDFIKLRYLDNLLAGIGFGTRPRLEGRKLPYWLQQGLNCHQSSGPVAVATTSKRGVSGN